MVKRGRLTSDQKDAVFGLVDSSLDYSDLKDCDIVIEAVYENLDLKEKIFKSLDEQVKPGAILASNTSGLDIDSIASVTNRPELVVGTHFFSPANIMRLLEVVRGAQTSDETLATVMAIGKKLKKAAVVSLNAPGFIGNRMLFRYTAQANMLLLEGALPHQIDQALESFGLNMGPFRMMDLVGLDLGWRARKLGGKESPLQSSLKNGDMIKIITSKKVSPSLHWLSSSKTGKARASIRKHWQGRFLDKEAKSKEYSSTLSIDLPHKPGILGKVSTLIGVNNANIINIELTNRGEEYLTFLFDIQIKDLKDFTNLISQLKQEKLKFKVIRHKKKKYAFIQRVLENFKRN